jgi:hypothetical protein
LKSEINISKISSFNPFFFFNLAQIAVKESLDNSKIARKLEDRRTIDDINFKKAAIGPIKKTYKYDPTKVENRNS